MSILNKLVCEKAYQDPKPQRKNPDLRPVIHDEVLDFLVPTPLLAGGMIEFVA